MREYTIVRRPETGDWNKVEKLSIDNLLLPEPTQVQAWAQLCYDDEALYVRMGAVEKDIRAELTGPLDPICQDSCLEFFFCPILGDKRYINIECNPNGCLFLGTAHNIDSQIRFIPSTPSILPEIQRTADGWELTYTVPYTFIRQIFPEFSPAAGKAIRANCYKCGDKTVKPHWLTWNPVPYQRAAFHNPDAFGTMYFA